MNLVFQDLSVLFLQEVPTVRLRLRKPKSNKKVQWKSGTVDNENMNKKKSKCKFWRKMPQKLNFLYCLLLKVLIEIFFSGCCIYEKPKKFGESSSDESDDECEHCHGHKDAHKKVINKAESPGGKNHP